MYFLGSTHSTFFSTFNYIVFTTNPDAISMISIRYVLLHQGRALEGTLGALYNDDSNRSTLFHELAKFLYV